MAYYPPPQPYPPPRHFDPIPYPTTQSPITPSASYPAPASFHIDPYHHHHPNAAPMVPEHHHINTLFVSGLPNDVKAREIHNLFRRRSGFDSCQLKYTGRGDQVVAFATFFNHQTAMAALNTLNGVTFDPQSGATLHIELARSNSRSRPRGSGGYAIIDKRARVANDEQEVSSNDGDDGSDEPLDTENHSSSNRGALATIHSGRSPAKMENTQAALTDQSGDIPPCSTLFIANLGPTCTEVELKQILFPFVGFETVKMRGRGGMPVAFADFMDVESSTAAMNKLQGTLLESSDRGGMHLEYARSKMRKS